jgi:hypothetical protein
VWHWRARVVELLSACIFELPWIAAEVFVTWAAVVLACGLMMLGASR